MSFVDPKWFEGSNPLPNTILNNFLHAIHHANKYLSWTRTLRPPTGRFTTAHTMPTLIVTFQGVTAMETVAVMLAGSMVAAVVVVIFVAVSISFILFPLFTSSIIYNISFSPA